MKNNRSTMPSVKKILDYWDKQFEKEELYDILCTDIKGKPISGCFACGSQLKVERAHITALIDDGNNDVDNLHLLCRSCHADSDVFNGDEYMDWFYWRINQPGYMAVRLAMMGSTGKLPTE